MIKQTHRLTALLVVLLAASPLWAEIYRVVDKDGNVIYTDQPPADDSKPLDLPDLSVIQSDAPDLQTEGNAMLEQQEADEMEAFNLRKAYSDFHILQPADEETFWGTANQVVVSWGSIQPLQPDMTVRLIVDGSPMDVTGQESISLTLDRGTHDVRIELSSGGKKPFLTTEPVIFYVKQASIGGNRPSEIPGGA